MNGPEDDLDFDPKPDGKPLAELLASGALKDMLGAVQLAEAARELLGFGNEGDRSAWQNHGVK